MEQFSHLKLHTEYSIIDSIIKIELLIKKAKNLDLKSLVISDYSNFFGLIKFYRCCYMNNIKPIIGIDLLINNDDKFNVITELTLLIQNNIGYKNLIKIISMSYKNKKYKFPIINYELLIKYNDGLIIISGGVYGYLGYLIINQKNKEIVKYLDKYLKYFNNRYYIEISRIGINYENYYIYKSIEISKKFSIPLVSTNNVVFLEKNEFDIHNIKVKINKKINFDFNKKKYTKNQYFKSPSEMNVLFQDIPESIINVIEILKMCNLYINFGKYYIPKFNKKIKSSQTLLTRISKYELNNKFNKIFNNNLKIDKYKKIYYERLYKELNIINKIKFPDYFLIVMEFVNWAKKHNISVGPGRGSGAGSLISYILNITELDPIKFGLIFERFLNPERISMPDMDIDFCIEKRDFVINHVIKRYGKEYVAKIITFSTMTAKSVIKDVGRSLEYPYTFVKNITKIIPNSFGFNLINAFNIKEFLFLYKNDEDVKYLIDIALKLEGTVRNIGKHAGGIIISPRKIINLIPLHYDYLNDCYITQFDKNDIEKIGLIKFDFLGLKTLSIINKTVNEINKKTSNKININNISLSDKKSFEILKSSKTNAIFQLESNGIKKIIRYLQPNNFEDLIALIALFRPGPLKSGMINNFINRKNGFEKIFYPDKNMEHKILKNILYSTYGIILYQEQIIKIAQKFSNYSLSEADLFRIAISKKKIKDMNNQKKKFIEGAINKKINKNLAEKIFDIIEKFSGYGFNKSHSAAYALISYRTLWLKSNYKEEFMSSVMNFDINNSDKISNLIKECNKLSIKVNPIDINVSEYEFYVNKNNEIESGMGSIKGISDLFIKNIILDRNKNGLYINMLNFAKRINLYKFGKKNLEILFINNVLKTIYIDYSKNTINKYFNISKEYFDSIKNNQTKFFFNIN